MRSIIIIDDNSDYRLSIIEILSLENYELLEAENGEAGLNLIRLRSPDLILCDVDMPLTSGVEVLGIVKTDPEFRNIPFIIITGRSEKRTQKICHDLGVDLYLIKPVSIIELISSIFQLLNSSDFA